VDFFKASLVIVFSYLIGSILTGEIVGGLKRVNLRKEGSGNIGATNVYRSMGSAFGAVVLFGDALKGMIAVSLSKVLVGKIVGFDAALLAGIFVVIGHNWSLFAKFKGGKGIATSLGVIIAATPLSLLIVLPVWLLTFFLSGFVSLASVLAALSYPVSAGVFYPGRLDQLLFSIILVVLAVYRHKTNLLRLFKGQEHRILYNSKRSGRK